MSKQQGQEEAIRLARDKLATLDLEEQCERLGLPSIQNSHLELRTLGQNLWLGTANLELVDASTGEPAKPDLEILTLHYLISRRHLVDPGHLITFRDFPGGCFYWEPFRVRSVLPLAKAIGNDLDRLRANLGRFDWEPVDKGDLGARIHLVGKLHALLIYRLGDEEFPATADLVFEEAVRRVYSAEDAAVIAGKICIGLI